LREEGASGIKTAWGALLLLLRTFVKRKIRINTPNVLSQQLNRNVFSLALKTSSEMSGD